MAIVLRTWLNAWSVARVAPPKSMTVPSCQGRAVKKGKDELFLVQAVWLEKMKVGCACDGSSDESLTAVHCPEESGAIKSVRPSWFRSTARIPAMAPVPQTVLLKP